MVKKVWTFTLKDGNHTVELEHGIFSSKRIITVDGVEIRRSPAKIELNPYAMDWHFGSDHHFRVAGVLCLLKIRVDWRFLGFKYKYELDVGEG